MKRGLLLVAVVTVLVIGAASSWLIRQGPAFYSSPTAPRTNTPYNLILHEPPEAHPDLPDTALLEPVRMEQEENSVRLILAENRVLQSVKDFTGFVRYRTKGGEPVRIGEGTIRLGMIGVGYGVPNKSFDYSCQVPGKFYSADLKPLAAEERKKIGPQWKKDLDFEGAFPAVEFTFLHTNMGDIKPLTFDVFESRTRQKLNSGYSTWNGTDWLVHGCEVKLWRPAPVEVASTFARGPVRTNSLAAEAGAEAHFPGAVVKVLGVFERPIQSWGSSSSEGTNTVTLEFGPKEEKEPEFSAAFLIWPKAFAAPVEIQAIRNDGKNLAAMGSGSSDQILRVTYAGRKEDLKEFRVRYFENIHRLIVALPEIPGLPEENRNLKNLFHTRIPYIRLRYEHDLRQSLQALVAMEMAHVPMNWQQGHFPLAFTNLTPMTLLGEIERFLPPGKNLVAVPEKNAIELRDPPVQELLRRMRQVIGK